MKKVESIQPFKRLTKNSPKEKNLDLDERKRLCGASAAIQAELSEKEAGEKLTKAGVDFRKRFQSALDELRKEIKAQVKSASKASDIKLKINVSTVLKRSKSSPLAAYSPLHKDVVLAMVENARMEIQELVETKFSKAKQKRPTVMELQKIIEDERLRSHLAITALASQKMAEFLAHKTL